MPSPFSKLFTIAIGLLLGFFIAVLTSQQNEIDTLKLEQAKMLKDQQALWLNQKETILTINGLVTDVERLKDTPEYIDPAFDMSGVDTPVSPIDDRY